MATFTLSRTEHPTPADERAAIVAKPVFGANFTDHMALAIWRDGQGWADREIVGRRPFELHPGAATFHYGQEIFEGLKAFRQPDKGVAIFRPEKNAARFANSARRLAMAPLPEDDFVAAVTELVDLDRDWVPSPDGEQSLYLRPFEIASETLIGVRAAKEYTFCVIASPVGPYYPEPVTLWATPNYTRAAEGGTGAAKCGGNYAASLAAAGEAADHGCQQVIWLDGVEHRWVEECGTMNIMFVTAAGELVTPALTGTILDGVTRDSILALAPEHGLTPVQRRVAIDEVFDGVEQGTITEVFACGTAAVVTPVVGFAAPGVNGADRSFIVGAGTPGPISAAVRSHLLDIQYGRVEDTRGWLHHV
ncbi:branched-chain amino acid aminotransferase [Micropruina sonneratiae]|uniref:branched-chain amino acid aminotransferase n=1 Tax=Micropruina sonneratiae TaxID=2986940 RepID=UPI0022273B5A|nr:branched-chain amino acid aminotransferase [Micropruina sp. KQZ13P-5]MCW3158990.1 branched-chain amino acid aminotransferase [Micropruina sp. KQZ13P-5]